MIIFLLKILWYIVNSLFRVFLLFLIIGLIVDYFYFSGDAEFQNFNTRGVVISHVIVVLEFIIYYFLKLILFPKLKIDYKEISFISILKEINGSRTNVGDYA